MILMAELSVHKSNKPWLKPAASTFLFHTTEYISYQHNEVLYYGLLLDGVPVSQISFVQVGNNMFSMPKSPFGGFIIDGDMPTGGIQAFIKAIVSDSKIQNLQSLHITLPPACYGQHILHQVCKELEYCGFQVSNEYPNQYITITEKDFRQLLDGDERRYLNRAATLKMTFRKLDLSYLSEAYTLFRACRDAKGYDISMSEEQLLDTMGNFPREYMLFGLFLDKAMIAASLCIQVNEHILYDFYHGDSLAHRQYSPIIPLMQGIYEYSRNIGVELLDLGTSIAPGVFKFKKHMGAKASVKKSYCYQVLD